MVRKTGVQSGVGSNQRLKKMVLDVTLLNPQHYKVLIKGKVEQSRELSSAVPYTSVWKLLKREPPGHPRQRSPTLLFTFIFACLYICTYVPVYVCVYMYMSVCVRARTFGAVSLFNGISTYVGYLMPKPYMQNNNIGVIYGWSESKHISETGVWPHYDDSG